MKYSAKGAVLPLVLGIILAITMMLTALFNLPGGAGRVALAKARELQRIYDEESAVVAHLNGFPGNYFAGAPWFKRLPEVSAEEAFPWVELHTDSGRVHVLCGMRYDSLSREEKLRMGAKFKQELSARIRMSPEVSTKSGNRRLMGRGRNTNLIVMDGDLKVDWEGNVPVCNFMASGNLEVLGDATFDTLRLYASGNLRIAGKVKARWLEAYCDGIAEVAEGAHYSGMLMAYQGVTLRNPQAVSFPAGAIPLNGPLEVPVGRSMTLPAGLRPWIASRAESAGRPDSLGLLLPASSGDSPFLLVPFRWSLP